MKSLQRGRLQRAMAGPGADDECCGGALRKILRPDINPEVGRSVLRKINHRFAPIGKRRYRHEAAGRVGGAGALVGAGDVVHDREIGSLGIIGQSDPDRCGGGIIGERHMQIGVPRQVGELDRRVIDRDTGM